MPDYQEQAEERLDKLLDSSPYESKLFTLAKIAVEEMSKVIAYEAARKEMEVELLHFGQTDLAESANEIFTRHLKDLEDKG